MRLSIRTKILLLFVVVFLSFGGAAIYGAWAVHTLGQHLRLVAEGYWSLRFLLQEPLTLQTNLRNRLQDPQSPRFLKDAAADRKLRRALLKRAASGVGELRRSLPPADAAYLDEVARQLAEVDRLYAANEPLFEDLSRHGHGPLEQVPPELLQREELAANILGELATDLNARVFRVVDSGRRYERRTTWVTLLLMILSAGIGTLVVFLVQFTLRPLRRLAESAREVARGNYRQRVGAATHDEIGALGREFNAMAAALIEREQSLRRSEQLATVGKMAAQITHEVRNPLSSIGLNAELLADEVAGTGTEAQTLAQAIVKEVDRLTDITEQYLRFARLPEPRFEREDVSEVVRGLLQFIRGELAGRGVTLAAELLPGLPAVLLDDNQLRPALLNLLRNAAEAMAALPPAGRVLGVRTLALAGDGGDRVVIEIADRGPGIPAEHRSRVFEPFFTTKKGGTGLGLALTHEVVLRHSGSLRVESPPEGGARFIIELPAAGPQEGGA